MNLVTWKKILSLVLLFFTPHLVWGGHISSGGGGGGIVCRNQQNEIHSAELLDFWEARFLPHRTLSQLWESPKIPASRFEIPVSDKPVEWQVRKAFDKVSRHIPLLGEKLSEVYRYYRNPENQWQIPVGVKIPPPKDANELATKDCGDSLKSSREGIMVRYRPYDRHRLMLQFNTRIYEKMDSKTEQAGIWAHEAISDVMASYSSTAKARQWTGCLFSNTDCFPIKSAFDYVKTYSKESRYLSCSSLSSKFYVFNRGKSMELIDDLIEGKSMREIKTMQFIFETLPLKASEESLEGLGINALDLKHLEGVTKKRIWPKTRLYSIVDSSLASVGHSETNIGLESFQISLKSFVLPEMRIAIMDKMDQERKSFEDAAFNLLAKGFRAKVAGRSERVRCRFHKIR